MAVDDRLSVAKSEEISDGAILVDRVTLFFCYPWTCVLNDQSASPDRSGRVTTRGMNFGRPNDESHTLLMMFRVVGFGCPPERTSPEYHRPLRCKPARHAGASFGNKRLCADYRFPAPENKKSKRRGNLLPANLYLHLRCSLVQPEATCALFAFLLRIRNKHSCACRAPRWDEIRRSVIIFMARFDFEIVGGTPTRQPAGRRRYKIIMFSWLGLRFRAEITAHRPTVVPARARSERTFGEPSATLPSTVRLRSRRIRSIHEHATSAKSEFLR